MSLVEVFMMIAIFALGYLCGIARVSEVAKKPSQAGMGLRRSYGPSAPSSSLPPHHYR
jgi:hypothetical protein